MPNALDLIAAELAKPTTHVVLTTYDDGHVGRHETRSLGSANNYATQQRRKIGRPLISRTTGQTVKVVSVEIKPL